MRLLSGGGAVVTFTVAFLLMGLAVMAFFHSPNKRGSGSDGTQIDASRTKPGAPSKSVEGSIESNVSLTLEEGAHKVQSLSADFAKMVSLPPHPIHQLFYLLSHHDRATSDAAGYIEEVKSKIDEVVADRRKSGSTAPDLNAVDSSTIIDSTGKQVSVSYPQSTYIEGDSGSSGGITGCQNQTVLVAVLTLPNNVRGEILKTVLSHAREGLVDLNLACPDADPNQSGFQTYTALMYAASKDDRDSVKALIAAGANPSTKVLGYGAEDIAAESCKDLLRRR